jgi:hypothetical protein
MPIRSADGGEIPRLKKSQKTIPITQEGRPATGRPSLQGRIVPTEAKPLKLSIYFQLLTQLINKFTAMQKTH